MSSPSSGEHSLLIFDDLISIDDVDIDSGPTSKPPIDNHEPEQEDAGLGGLFGLFDGPSDYPPGYHSRHVTPPSNGYQPQAWRDSDSGYEHRSPHRPPGPPYASQQGPSQPQYYRPEPEPVNHYHQSSFTRERYPPHQAPNYGPSGPDRRVHFDHGDPGVPHESQYGRYVHIPHHSEQSAWRGSPIHPHDRVTSDYRQPNPHTRTSHSYADHPHTFPSDAHYMYDAETRAYHGYPVHTQVNGSDWPGDGPVRAPLHSNVHLNQPVHRQIPIFGQQPGYAHQQSALPAFQVQQGPWVAAQPPLRPQPVPIVVPPNLIPVPHPVTGVPIYPPPNPAPFFPNPPPLFGQPSINQNNPLQASANEAATNSNNTSGKDEPGSGPTGTNDSSTAPDAWGNSSSNQNTTSNTDSTNAQAPNGDDWNNNNNNTQNNTGDGWGTNANDNSNTIQNTNGDEWGNSNNDNNNQNANGDEWANSNNDNNDNNNQDNSGDGWANDNSNQNTNQGGWDTSNDNQNNNESNWNSNNDAKQNDSGGGWGDNSQNGKPQSDSWNNNQATNTNGNADATPTPVNKGQRSLYGPHGAYFTSKVFADDVPADAEEEPRYDVPQDIAQDRGTSKQVQPGKGYIYNKKRCAPIYVDTMQEPYARFVFKYRTKEQIKSETGVDITAEPTGDEHINALEQLDKAELIQMVLRAKGALGGQIPGPSPKEAMVETPMPSFEQIPIPPPEVSFLKYNLPPARTVSNPGLGIKNAMNNNSNTQQDKTWDNNQQSSGDQNWESGGNNNTSGDGWNNINSGGASGWNDNTQDNTNNNNSGGGAGWDGQQESNDNASKNNSQSNTAQADTQDDPDEFARYLAGMGTAPLPIAPDWSTAAAPQIQTIGCGAVGGGTTSLAYKDKPPTPPLKPCSPPMQSSGNWEMGPPMEPEAPSGGGGGW